MNLAERDRRALKILATAIGAAALYLGYDYLPSSATTPATAATETVDMTEQRLARLRDIAASAAAKSARRSGRAATCWRNAAFTAESRAMAAGGTVLQSV